MQVADIEKAEKEKMHDKVKAICAHGINCFVNRQLVYNYPEELFADAGVMAIEHADFDGIERLALVTGVIADPMIGSYKGWEELFADAGVMAIKHADFDGIERLALVTGVTRGI